MKVPQSPPRVAEFFEEVRKTENAAEVMQTILQAKQPAEYFHWDKLKHLQPPDGLTNQEWWFAVKMHRANQYRRAPLNDVEGQPFVYGLPDPIQEQLSYIDRSMAGTISTLEKVANSDMKDRYLLRSLVEEAITSSQLEGAATTREQAKILIRSGRKPGNTFERMILNNYQTMQRISKLKKERLSKELILEIHRQVTSETLEDSTYEGRIRKANKDIKVYNTEGETLHVPPLADELEPRMEAMCRFANAESSKPYIHPVLRSIILHFWLAYDHPFVDGNGRTARALFYWSMLHQGYWLAEYISISEIILEGPVKYGRAFLYTESDDNDLTYFLLYHLEVIHRAVRLLNKYVERKSRENAKMEAKLRVTNTLNLRQRALVSHALRHPMFRYTFDSHSNSHGIVYQTARTDLLDLKERGILQGQKVAKQWFFRPAPDLEEILLRGD